MALDWEDLRFFLGIVRSGGIAAAASRLGVTQSTVYRRLDRLEAALGVRLLARGSRRLQLTTAGEDLAEGAGQMDDAALDLHNRILGQDLEPSGTVRLTTPDDLANVLVLPLLAGFQQIHPQITVELAIDNRNFDMSRREADIALRPTSKPPDTLVGRRIGDLGWAIYTHKSRAEVPVSAQNWILWEENLGPAGHHRWARAHVPADRINLRTNSMRIMAEAAGLGVGAAILPCFLGVSHENLVQLSGRHREWNTGLWILTHPDLKNTARIRLLTSYIFDALRQRRNYLLNGSDNDRSEPAQQGETP